MLRRRLSAFDVHERMRLEDVCREEWDALAARPPASVNGSRAWVAAAFATAHPDATPLIITVTVDDRLVGLLPLALHHPPSAPTVTFAGDPHNDLMDLMVLPGYEADAAAVVIDALVAFRNRGWAVRLDTIDPAGVLAAADRDDGLLRWSAGETAPTVDLRRPFEAAASARRRQQWRRRLRRLRERHAVEFQRHEGDDVVAALSEFVAMRAARLTATGRPADLPPVPFLTAVVRGLRATGVCAFMELLVDGRPAARDLYLLEPPVATMWLRALDPCWHRYPCGHLLLRASREAFAAEGYEVLDLGRGDEPYKYLFGAERRVLLSARA